LPAGLAGGAVDLEQVVECHQHRRDGQQKTAAPVENKFSAVQTSGKHGESQHEQRAAAEQQENADAADEFLSAIAQWLVRDGLHWSAAFLHQHL